MALPPIPQHQPGPAPLRAPLGKLGERRAAQQPPLCDSGKTSTDKGALSSSWPSATLRRHKASVGQQGEPLPPARRFLEQVPRGMTRSYESVIQPRPSTLTRSRRELPRDPPQPGRRPPPRQHGAPHGHPEAASPKQQQDAPFSLCLTPEAVLVIQKRSLEKLRPQQRGARRIFASSGGGRCPRSCGQRSPPDVRELLKVSLLNDQHRYDDMEYEDECWLRDGDEGLVRKCTEWLQGVEMATGRGGNLHDKLQALPHLSSF